jgi:PKD repeat protein
MKRVLSSAFLLAAVALAGCTVHQTEAPGFTGPSGLALSMNVTALPDSISQDGGSQSSIQVTAFGPDGKPKSGVSVRVDMFVNGVGQDYGTLSARTLATNSSGVATVVYTAPPAPTAGIFGTCKGLPGNCVEIVATPTGTGFESANSERAMIRLVPPGVILPPASKPVAAFAYSPQPAAANVALQFDASNSQPGSGASQIVSYNWSFGDGTSGTGKTPKHTYALQGSYTVTLTVANDRTLSSDPVSQVVGVGAGVAPTVDFVFSPTAPVVNQSINFDASQARAGVGHTIAGYAWNFGDGSSKTGVTTTHDYGSAGTYNVTLTVTDETGQATTVTKAVPVTVSGGGGGGGGTAASFVASPTAPVVGQVVFFNASASSAATGHTLTKYAWDFGDGTAFAGATASATHTVTTVGTFTV